MIATIMIASIMLADVVAKLFGRFKTASEKCDNPSVIENHPFDRASDSPASALVLDTSHRGADGNVSDNTANHANTPASTDSSQQEPIDASKTTSDESTGSGSGEEPRSENSVVVFTPRRRPIHVPRNIQLLAQVNPIFLPVPGTHYFQIATDGSERAVKFVKVIVAAKRFVAAARQYA
ncbi:Hypp1365 [Branchiostoma lanceolatum]|uniref:Hypp1365 protein n=1 Tax=Branchiostoma lanceolatum TaxID=7740 RepID=A0A8J9ZJ05_BRALA|nr:Hypp1365 [Branchiostoma lanceolatum]